MLTVTIIGRLGADAKLNYPAAGKEVINFSVAHTERYTDTYGVKKEKTVWVNCSKWVVQSSAILPYLKKGTLVAITGKPFATAYKNHLDDAVPLLNCTVDHIELLSASQNSQVPGPQEEETMSDISAGLTTGDDVKDDLPF